MASEHNKPQELFTFSTNKLDNKLYHGIELLPDGRILLASWEDESLCQFNSAGELKKHVILPGKSFDVTMLNNRHAAVSFGYQYPYCGICVVDIDKMKIKQQNIVQCCYYRYIRGIAKFDDTLFFVCSDKIIAVDKIGTLKGEIKTPGTSSFNRFITAISHTKVCYTNYSDNSVVCVELDGRVMFTYKHYVLKKPEGITSDSEGILYVAGYLSNNVHQISPMGQLLKIILCKDDGITDPSAIHYDQTNNKLALTHSGSKITVYQIGDKSDACQII